MQTGKDAVGLEDMVYSGAEYRNKKVMCLQDLHVAGKTHGRSMSNYPKFGLHILAHMVTSAANKKKHNIN
jgi:hypothetical protein